LLLATGASPIRPSIPGADLAHVHVLRSFDDCRALIAAAGNAQRIVIAGASFIGMEAAASLRQRGVDVVIVAPEAVPFAKVLGPEIGSALKEVHEENGVVFRLGRTVQSIGRTSVTLDDGSEERADVVLLGIGVRPRVALAEQAGLQVDRGVVVNAYLETSAAGVYAAGDIARYPDPVTNAGIRIEHWAVAQNQGRAAARNLLGAREPFTTVPFFWTRQYDLGVNYTGHAEQWSETDIDGSPRRDCSVAYRQDGRVLAVATINRDRASLEAERRLEAQ
jgi:NADPH-dependent 2,4-dienoyl-CoA reductase/sulfur reductase-like enzyme